MPGLKQLKKFSDDITTLGNEPKRRQERGDTMPQEPFPADASEADDSEDFVLGLPQDGDKAESTDSADDSSSLNLDTLDPITEDIDVQTLLNSVASESDTQSGTSSTNSVSDDLDFSLPGIDTVPDFVDFSDFDINNDLPKADDLTSSDELSYTFLETSEPGQIDGAAAVLAGR